MMNSSDSNRSSASEFTARAPGKAMLIGEYAVLDGGPAVVAAVGCYAIARRGPELAAAPTVSPFLLAAMRAATAVIAELRLPADPARFVPLVDTSAFSDGGRKLGVGSSAAATVSALGLLCAQAGADLGDCRVLEAIRSAATRAHDEAQGVRGSGADVLAAVHGGVRVLNEQEDTAPLPVVLRFVATNKSAVTADLVARYREVGSAADGARADIERAATGFLRGWRAGSAKAVIDAAQAGYEAFLALAAVLDRELVTAEHATIAAAARRAGGSAKPSGAGGGDLAVVFLPDEDAAARLRTELPAHLKIQSFGLSERGLHLGAPEQRS